MKGYREARRLLEELPLEELGPRMKEAQAVRDKVEAEWVEKGRPRRGSVAAKRRAAQDAAKGLAAIHGLLTLAIWEPGVTVGEASRASLAQGVLSAAQEGELEDGFKRAAQGLAGKGLPFSYRGR